MAYVDLNSKTSEPSLGELVGQATKELSTLVRKEIELAKTELSVEVGKAGKGAGMFGGAGVTAIYGLTFLSLAAMFGLGEVMPLGFAALIVAGVYLVLAAILAIRGKKAFKDFSPKPERTIRTLKEDAQWARHPSS
ncbi:MAG TPA: phage holin family protein [Frankiaceae bacterium]|nr:phage holin family protein [Frankiaceae bacterium]